MVIVDGMGFPARITALNPVDTPEKSDVNLRQSVAFGDVMGPQLLLLATHLNASILNTLSRWKLRSLGPSINIRSTNKHRVSWSLEILVTIFEFLVTVFINAQVGC